MSARLSEPLFRQYILAIVPGWHCDAKGAQLLFPRASTKDITGRMLVWEKCYRPELLPQFQTGV
jgi:hypothetical protein